MTCGDDCKYIIHVITGMGDATGDDVAASDDKEGPDRGIAAALEAAAAALGSYSLAYLPEPSFPLPRASEVLCFPSQSLLRVIQAPDPKFT